MQHCLVYARINYYTHASTSCDSLVKIGAVTSEFKRAKYVNLPRLGCNLMIVVHLAIWHAGILKRLEYQNFDFSRLIGSELCISCENLVTFR